MKNESLAAPVQPGPRCPECGGDVDFLPHQFTVQCKANEDHFWQELQLQSVADFEQFFPVAASAGTTPPCAPTFDDVAKWLRAVETRDWSQDERNDIYRLLIGFYAEFATSSSDLSPEVEKRLAEVIAEAIRHKQRLTNKYRDNTLVPLILEQIESLRRRLAQQPEKHAIKAGKYEHMSPFDTLVHAAFMFQDLAEQHGSEADKDAATMLQELADKGSVPAPTPATVTVQPGEWISVEDRLPVANHESHQGEFVQVAWKPEWWGRKLSNNIDDNSIASPCGIDTCFIPYFVARHYHQATHWQPLPAPPSGATQGDSEK